MRSKKYQTLGKKVNIFVLFVQTLGINVKSFALMLGTFYVLGKKLFEIKRLRSVRHEFLTHEYLR